MTTTLSNNEEKYLLSQLAKGDHGSYEKLFYSYYKDLCRFCIRYVRSNEVSEEIVQDVFIYLWEKRKVINITISFKSYLYTAVRNKSINYLKLQLPKDHAKEDIDNFEITSTYNNIESELTFKELSKKVNNAIDSLPKKCKAIFLLSREDGHTYREIAKELGISVKTVENQMVIALRKLREHLIPYWDHL